MTRISVKLKASEATKITPDYYQLFLASNIETYEEVVGMLVPTATFTKVVLWFNTKYNTLNGYDTESTLYNKYKIIRLLDSTESVTIYGD